jgi:hypothetical protein
VEPPSLLKHATGSTPSAVSDQSAAGCLHTRPTYSPQNCTNPSTAPKLGTRYLTHLHPPGAACRAAPCCAAPCCHTQPFGQCCWQVAVRLKPHNQISLRQVSCQVLPVALRQAARHNNLALLVSRRIQTSCLYNSLRSRNNSSSIPYSQIVEACRVPDMSGSWWDCTAAPSAACGHTAAVGRVNDPSSAVQNLEHATGSCRPPLETILQSDAAVDAAVTHHAASY